MTTARINNLKNKGDGLLVRFSPNTLAIEQVEKLKLLTTIIYDASNMQELPLLQDFMLRNKQETISFTYKSICVVGHILSYDIEHTLFDDDGRPLQARINIVIEET